MNCNESTRIINSENLEQLRRIRDEELAHVRKLRMVIKELKQLDCTKMAVPDTEQIEKALKVVKIADHLHLNEKKEFCLFRLEKTFKVTLNYTERKAVRRELSQNLQNNLQLIQDYRIKLQEGLPELFSDSSLSHDIILRLETQRRSNLEKLVEVHTLKSHYLKVAAELKMGPYLAYELDIDLAKARQNQTKTKVLRGYFNNELLTRTEHSLKAMREIETSINDALEKEMDASN